MAPVNLDTDLLRTLMTIAETASFTRAAERLDRTQSTISLQIKRLEDQLGRRLLDRNARHVSLTADGEIIATYARDILRLNDEAVARLTEPEVAGVVRLGTPEDFATHHLPDVLRSFRESHPRVSLEVTCDLTLNLLDMFAAGDFDLVLIKREPQGPGGGLRVWREPLVWAAIDPGVLREGEPVPLVVSPHPCVYRKRATGALDRSGTRWRIAYTSPSLAGAQAAMRAGLGISILPREMVPGGFVTLEHDAALPRLDDMEIALMAAPGLAPPPVARLSEHIVRSLERAGDRA